MIFLEDLIHHMMVSVAVSLLLVLSRPLLRLMPWSWRKTPVCPQCLEEVPWPSKSTQHLNDRSHGMTRPVAPHPESFSPSAGSRPAGSTPTSLDGPPKCRHCNGNHYSEKCFKEHGYPDWFADYKARMYGPKAACTMTQDETRPPAPSANLCASDTMPGMGSNTWIIDTGASDHMTYDTNMFDELSRNPRDPYITSANGLPSPVTGEGTIHLTPSLPLSHALLVPNIRCNLLSIGRLLDTLNVSATFYSTHCFFQDLKTHFCVMVSTQFHASVKVFRTDNGGEYVNHTLTQFFRDQGIIHQTTTPFTPQQNGVSERKNRQLLEVARSLMLDMSVSHHLWGHGVLAAVYLINRTPSRVLDFQTPLDVLCAHTPPISVSKLPPKGERGSELKSFGMEDLGCIEASEGISDDEPTTGRLEDATGRQAICANSTGRAEGNDRSPLTMRDECIETTSRPEDTTSGPTICANPTGRTEEECNSDIGNSCEDEIDIRPPSALPLSQSTRDDEVLSNDVSTYPLPPRTTRGKPKVQYSPDIHAKSKYPINHYSGCYTLLQFDVKNAFLHGDLKEEIYMDPPPGIPVTSKEGMVCKLRKSLYGLKQSPRAWFGRFAASMRKSGYVQSNSDHTLFLKRRKGRLTALIIYIDDMIVTGDDQAEIQSLQKYLASEFEMKSLGDLKYFLGIEERYQRLVGKLIYLAHTRPDIAYAVSVVSQFMHAPSEDHMAAVTRILRYLKVTPGKGLMFSKYGHTDVEGYTDADWASSATDRRSTSGYFTFVGGNLVTWRSKKQKVVSRSSAEAKYRGMAHGVCELLWLRRLLRDLGFGPKKPMDLYCDNKAAIAIAHNPVQHDRTKHVEVDRNFIKEKLDAEIVSFPFISSEYQLADVLTKAVSTSIFHNSLDKLGMRDVFAPT
ncbi:unnamed protein product [Prunus brigantina]